MTKTVKIKIADVCFEISLNDIKIRSLKKDLIFWTKRRFKDFLSKEKGGFFIDVEEGYAIDKWEDIRDVKLVGDKNNSRFILRLNGSEIGFIDTRTNKANIKMGAWRSNDKVFLLSSFLEASLQLALIQNSGFLVHSCGVVREKTGYLFLAPAEGGKTTVAHKSRKFRVLSDDCNALKREGNDWFIYQTPWGRLINGKVEKVRLAKIFFLKKAKYLEIKELSFGNSLIRFFSQIHMSGIIERTDLAEKILEEIENLARNLRFFELSFSKKSRIWEAIGNK